MRGNVLGFGTGIGPRLFRDTYVAYDDAGVAVR